MQDAVETHTDRHIGAFDTTSHAKGPTLIVIGALHGNETAGVTAVRRVLARLHDEKPKAFKGRLTAYIGNKAAHTHDPPVRYFESDLNRMFTREGVAELRSRPEVELAAEQLELRALLTAVESELDRGPALLLDLHTYSSTGPPFVVFEDSLPARALARAIPLPLVLGMEEELRGLLFDHITQSYKIPALIIEGGTHEDPAAVDVLEAALWLMLDAAKILPLTAINHEVPPLPLLIAAAGDHARAVFDARAVEPITSLDFTITEGLTSLDPTHIAGKPRTIATQNNQPLTAPVKGNIFLPNRNKVRRIGDDAYFVIKAVKPWWLALSATLRRNRLLHWLIAHAPGVTQHPTRPNALVVDTHIAAILPRQVFHLLGYRLLRHGTEARLTPARRAIRLILLIPRLMRLTAQTLISRPPPARANEWVVARHTLDISHHKPEAQ